MCGIVGYLGKKSVVPLILKGLSTLEYRGYDSAGLALVEANQLEVYKASGKLNNLKAVLPQHLFSQNGHAYHVGIGHTRWATHGAPNNANAHPHISPSGRFALIHNGIIENYAELRTMLQEQGYPFQSETDSECVVVLLEALAKQNTDFLVVLTQLAAKLTGAYALVILDKENPSSLYGLKHHAPLVAGLGKDEYLLGSDVVALAEHTSTMLYLRDGEMIQLSIAGGQQVYNFQGQPVEPHIETIESNLMVLDKKGYKHYMLKEIHEQTDVIRNTLSDRLLNDTSPIQLFSPEITSRLKQINRVYIVACGTSFNAGMVGKYFIEDIARLPVGVESAGEFRYRKPIIDHHTLVIAISQSGETADTLMAVRQSAEQGAMILAMTNREQSSIARVADCVLNVRAGLEVSVCATKSFTAQVMVLYLFGLFWAELFQTAELNLLKTLKAGLLRLPVLAETILQDSLPYQTLAKKYGHVSNMIFMARHINYPVAMEGALKLKEISYIHAEGYSASELKHGPIALLDPSMPVFSILVQDHVVDKMISNCQEAKARDAKIIGIYSGLPSVDTQAVFDDLIVIPEVHPALSPILTCIPLQLFAYYVAEYLGKDVDQPRNLAKSVTVE
jgi:glutamine---fructose-6-phosphate transaminase (isomerizing)